MRLRSNRAHGLSALNMLALLPTSSVGAVISDPPFFIGIRRDEGGVGDDPWVRGVASMDDIVAWSEPLAAEIARVLRPGGACVFMGGAHSLSGWEIAASHHDLKWMAEVVVLWNTGKPRSRNFGSLHTLVRWYIKPGARHQFDYGDARAIYSNILVCDKVPLADRVHPAQKPVELTNFFVSLLTLDDDLVVDPFCGSGSTLVSAAMCDRRFIGSDEDTACVDVANRRVVQLELEAAALKPLHLWINNRLIPVEG